MSLSELSRRERKKEETRRRIFDVAVELFRANGFEATTVDEITEKADVGRGTFFNYFPRKEAVLAYLSAERLALAEEALGGLLESGHTLRQTLLGLFGTAITAYEADRDLSRFVFAEWMKRGLAPMHDDDTRWQRLVIALLERGRTRDELRADVDDYRAEALLTGTYMATIFQWLFCPADCRSSVPNLGSELTARLNIVIDGLTLNAGVR
jgi:TetR/AcrR family transcriptional regulator, cholesterol catabolism regulator